MKIKTKAAILSAGAVLSAAAIEDRISRALDSRLVGAALDREEPKSIEKMKTRLKGYAELDESIFLPPQRTLENTPHTVPEIRSFDNTRLTGHLFRAAAPKRAIVAMHGWRSCWARDFGLVADFLLKNDCTVLFAEQRGQGHSDGAHMGFGMLERYDCLEWIRWLNANGCDSLPIYLAGISMGAATVLMTAGFPDLPENVTGILADCGFTSAKAVWQHISERNLHIPYRRHQKHVESLCRKRIDLQPDAYSTLDAMRTNRTPVLFIHGSADSFVPMQMTLDNYAACQAPKRLLIVEGANHGMSYLTDKSRYEAAVKAFWQELESR